MTAPPVSDHDRALYSAQAATAAAAVDAVGEVFNGFDYRDVGGWWAGVRNTVLALLGRSQARAAATAAAYQAAVLRDAGIAPTPDAVLDPLGFAGHNGDGVPLLDPLDSVPVWFRADLAAGLTQEEAAAKARYRAELIATTETQRAADRAAFVGRTTEPAIRGWERYVNLPACGRCIVLAGRRYKANADFPRHPNCFPAGVVVSGPGHEAATRRWYDGELVVLTTASGQNLSLTGNHPVLTGRGWVPANLLVEGDEVVRSTRPEGAGSLVVPDHHEVPSRIEDVWDALRVAGLRRVPAATEDFHGDGQKGEVDVVGADRPLSRRQLVALSEPVVQRQFAHRGGAGLPLDVQRVTELLNLGDAAHARGSVSGLRLCLALLLAHLRGAQVPGLAHAPAGHPSGHEALSDGSAAYAVLLGQGIFAGAGEVSGDDLRVGQVSPVPRWDAPAGPLSAENVAGYAGRGRDLLHRLAGQIEPDRLVDVRRVRFAGHVYSLSSTEGWHTANNLIVSNCDCTAVAITEADDRGPVENEPSALFESMTVAQQDKAFTKAGARAIREGADVSQIVNARRGALGLIPAGAKLTADEAATLRNGLKRGRLRPAQVNGRDVFVTSEGTTVRAGFGRRMAQEGQVSKQGGRYRQANTPRLMPESLSEIAGDDREMYLHLLRRFGYLRD